MSACFVTGHRPNRFHFQEDDPRCGRLKNTIRAEIIRLYEQKGVRGVWVGSAAGVDTWAAEIVLDLLHQNQYHELDLYVAIPFPDHGEAFEPKQKERYQRIFLRTFSSPGLAVSNSSVSERIQRRISWLTFGKGES